jgi:thiol-disulfide isomerase/thioredoxin
MGTTVKVIGMAVAMGVPHVFCTAAIGADRTAEQVLAEFDALKYPRRPGTDAGKAALDEYLVERERVWQAKDALILELYRIAPRHERTAGLMGQRWGRRASGFESLFAEIDAILAHDDDPQLRIEATFVKARDKLYENRDSDAPDLSLVEEFLRLAPGDPRGRELLARAAGYTRDEAARATLNERIIKSFPDSPEARRDRSARLQHAALGKPFDLAFNDAVTGSPVSMKALRGKVVVIDFWATWCLPCVAEMPNLKKLHAEYKNKGVAFIGVSLDLPEDQGGLEKLKEFVAENAIEWPQYYQGKGWQGEFSQSWGIHSIPRTFLIDAEGNLYSVEARGKLDTMIPALLVKPQAPDASDTR